MVAHQQEVDCKAMVHVQLLEVECYVQNAEQGIPLEASNYWLLRKKVVEEDGQLPMARLLEHVLDPWVEGVGVLVMNVGHKDLMVEASRDCSELGKEHQ